MPSKWRTIISWVHKIRLHGRIGKGTAESFSREKIRQAPQKEGGEILCDPDWCVRCVHKSDVQNKWDDNTHTTHTQCPTSGERLIRGYIPHTWFNIFEICDSPTRYNCKTICEMYTRYNTNRNVSICTEVQ